MGRAVGNVPPFEKDVAGVDLDKPGDAIDQGGLARPVRSDDAEDIPGENLEADPGQGLDAAEGLADIPDFQQGFGTHTLIHFSN